jgi:integrase
MSAGHIRQRSQGSWELRVDLPRDPNGQRRIRTETVRGTKRDAQRRLREILTEVDKGVIADAGKMTVGQWLELWLAECKHTAAPCTWEARASYVRQHMVPQLGAILLRRLTPDVIQGYLTALLTDGRRDGKGGLAASTVGQHERVLHVALARARKLQADPR